MLHGEIMQNWLVFSILVLVFLLVLLAVLLRWRAPLIHQPPAPRTVVYFGGSITAGAGASTAQNAWAAIIAQWLEHKFHQYAWTHTNSGLAGKSSWYGLIRLQNDLIAKNPDLVFLDFAVNDAGTSRGDLQNGFTTAAEAVIRRIRTKLPAAKLIALILARPDTTGKDARDMWIALARHYDIQFELLDQELTREIGSDQPTGEQLAAYFLSAIDVHPNDNGHRLIAAMIERDLLDLQPAWPKPIDRYGYYFPHSAIYEAEPIIRLAADHDAQSGEWLAVDGALESSQPGASISWSANLCSFGVQTNVGAGAGRLEWSLDGGPFTPLDLSTGTDSLKVIWNFPRAEHTVTIRVVSGKVQLHRFYGI